MGLIMMLSKLQKFYSNKITVWRKTLTLDDSGGYTQSWVKRIWDLPCRITTYKNMTEYKIAIEGTERLVTHTMTIDKTTELQLGDKITDDNYQEKYILVKIKRVQRFKDISHFKCYLALTEAEDME